MSALTPRLNWATAVCRRAGLRVTPVRRAMLEYLAHAETPVTLERVTAEIQGRHDAATVYRTLKLFVAARLLRVISTPRRSAHYLFNFPGESRHFLVCGVCGCIKPFQPSPDFSRTFQVATAEGGFASSGLSLEVHGCCATCDQQRKLAGLPSKLPG